MTAILTDTSPTGMTTAIEAGLEAATMVFAEALQVEMRVEPDMTIVVTRLPAADFNGVVRRPARS